MDSGAENKLSRCPPQALRQHLAGQRHGFGQGGGGGNAHGAGAGLLAA